MKPKIEIKYVALDNLKKSVYNPRDISEKDMKSLKKSMTEFGCVEPVVVNKDNTIISGHQRYDAAKDMGWKEVPVIYVDIVKAKEKALNIAMNKIGGEWDYSKLKDILIEIDTGDFDIDITGFDNSEIEELVTTYGDEYDNIEEDEVPEPPKVAKSKLGQVYQLGNHRLMCGDSTKQEDVAKLMDGHKADMVFTDPPYGIDLDTDFSDMEGIGVGKKYNKVIGDNKTFNPKPYMDNFNYVKEQIWWGADYYAESIPNKNDGSWFVWDKMGVVNSVTAAYDKMFGSNFELCWSKQKHKRALVRILWKGIFGLSKEDTKSRIHPTQKPVELSAWFIKKFSDKDNIIIDLFGGSGSTLIACEQTNRICYMMEIDPIYIDVIIQRWENLTKQKAKRL